MLRMKNIKKIYRTDLVETHALEDFSLNVEAGEFVALMGPSGSGKNTFLNVAGLLDVFEGGIYALDEGGYKVCFAPPGKPRPTALGSAPGSGYILQVWARQKNH